MFNLRIYIEQWGIAHVHVQFNEGFSWIVIDWNAHYILISFFIFINTDINEIDIIFIAAARMSHSANIHKYIWYHI